MIRAIIFDFDGLILETETPVLESWQEIYRAHGHELSLERWATNVGTGLAFDPLSHLQELTGGGLDGDAILEGRRSRQRQMVEALPILPGVEDRIAEAKALGLRLGVASSSSRTWVEGNLTRLGIIHHFHAVRSWDHPDVGARKPDPAVYLSALRALGVEGREAIALEDSINGVQSAAQAGMFTVVVPNPVTRRMGDPNAHLTLDSLADMTLERMALAAEALRQEPLTP